MYKRKRRKEGVVKSRRAKTLLPSCVTPIVIIVNRESFCSNCLSLRFLKILPSIRRVLYYYSS